MGPKLAEKHNKKWEAHRCEIDIETSFNFTWVTKREIERLVQEMCISKSSTIDTLSSRLLKDAFEMLSFELTYIHNACLQHAVFPLSWGLSKVTPIPKTNRNRTNPGDWRPISQIPLPGKILETITVLPTFGKVKLRRFSPSSKSYLFGGFWGYWPMRRFLILDI